MPAWLHRRGTGFAHHAGSGLAAGGARVLLVSRRAICPRRFGTSSATALAQDSHVCFRSVSIGETGHGAPSNRGNMLAGDGAA